MNQSCQIIPYTIIVTNLTLIEKKLKIYHIYCKITMYKSVKFSDKIEIFYVEKYLEKRKKTFLAKFFIF